MDDSSLSLDTSADPVQPQRVIASFWQRLIAFIIDGLIVGIPCTALGLSFQDYFSDSPAIAELVGFVISLPYFSILGSSIGGGQTLGHRILHLRVVNRSGAPLSLARSTIRYLILLTPFVITSAIISGFANSTLQSLVDLFLLGVGIAIIYLYLFNRRTRQSIHDVALGSFVIDAPLTGPVIAPPIWRGHWIILGSIFLGVILALLIVSKTIEQSPVMTDLLATQKAISASGRNRDASVLIQSTWKNGKSGKGVVVAIGQRSDSDQAAAREIAEIVLKTYPKASELDFIAVRFSGGFRIGFGSVSKSWSVSHTPQEWAENAQ
jgi:uncharacterized RDD family membrane protein YckC